MSENEESDIQFGIAVFRGNEIRKTIYNNEWWFVINDIIATLTGSTDPAQYFKRLKQRDTELATSVSEGGVQFVPPLSLEFNTSGGRQKMYCWNTEGIFRLIQSIPSSKAEPFKRWLAKVGYERVQEIEDPELAIKRTKTTYRLKGYSDEWIDKRMRGIDVRRKLTDEWKGRGVAGKDEYSILTSEISKAAFGLTPEEYKKHKGLDKPSENLRDHMTDLELILLCSVKRQPLKLHAIKIYMASSRIKRQRMKAVQLLEAPEKILRNVPAGKSFPLLIIRNYRRKRFGNFLSPDVKEVIENNANIAIIQSTGTKPELFDIYYKQKSENGWSPFRGMSIVRIGIYGIEGLP
jgi:prophage antirepressor-like protein